MKHPKGTGLEDRQKAAAAAKLQMLKKFKAAPRPDDPEMIAKRAERVAIAEAREARRAERERAKAEAAAREKAEAEAREKAETEARAKAEREEADRLVALEAERKAERDRRYAARKARNRR